MIHAVVVLDVGCLPGEVMGSIWELNLVPRPYGERPGDSETSCEIMSDSPVISADETLYNLYGSWYGSAVFQC